MILSFVKPSTRLEHRSSNAAPVQGHSSREAKFRDALCGLRIPHFPRRQLSQMGTTGTQ